MNRNSNMTIKDIAREAGVSKATVSRALNGSTKISLKTYEKILALIQKLQYEPSVEARKLAQRRWSAPEMNSPSFIPEEQPVGMAYSGLKNGG